MSPILSKSKQKCRYWERIVGVAPECKHLEVFNYQKRKKEKSISLPQHEYIYISYNITFKDFLKSYRIRRSTYKKLTFSSSNFVSFHELYRGGIINGALLEGGLLQFVLLLECELRSTGCITSILNDLK